MKGEETADVAGERGTERETHTPDVTRISLLREITLSDWRRGKGAGGGGAERGCSSRSGLRIPAPTFNILKSSDFYVNELLLEGHTFCTRHCLSACFGCRCALAEGTVCKFHAYFVLYTNLSFKETSSIERRAYNRPQYALRHAGVYSAQ